jgi:hypothetical protein
MATDKPEPLTDAQLVDVRKAYERMTPRPWFHWLSMHAGWTIQIATGWLFQASDKCNQHDAAGIVALVNSWPALLALLEQRTAALRLAEWNCAPGSGFCPVCHEPEEPMTYGNGKRVKGGHKRSCKLRAALLPSEGTPATEPQVSGEGEDV